MLRLAFELQGLNENSLFERTGCLSSCKKGEFKMTPMGALRKKENGNQVKLIPQPIHIKTLA